MRFHLGSATLGCGLALLAGACAFTRSGTLTNAGTGAVIPVSIEVGSESATVRGTNPANGERLEGTFHLEPKERTPEEVSLPGPPPPMGGGAVSPGTGPRPAARAPAVLNMSGRLEGDKGTSLRCGLQVKKGLNLEGVGVCRTAEGEGTLVVYRIRF